MRILLPLIFVLVSCSSQTEKFHLWSTKDYDETKSIIDENLYLFDNNLPLKDEGVLQDVYENCHLVDIDNDQDLDIIYTGWSGAESDCIRIFVNRNDSFKIQVFLWGKLTKVEPQKDGKYKFFVFSPGCCADPISQEYQSLITVLNDSVTNEYVSMILHNEYTVKPILEFDKYKRFKVTRSPYRLRYAPKIDSTELYSPGDQIGNIYEDYYKGNLGTAIGSEEDETGRIWWYVVMDSKPNDTLYSIYKEYKIIPQCAGWMSSRYLEEIRQQ